MHQVLARLKRDHVNLKRLLDLLETHLDRFHDGRDADFDLLCDILEYAASYADQVHHPMEEVLLRRMIERDSSLQALIDPLFMQHGALAQMGKAFRDSLECVLQGDMIEREEFEIEGRSILSLQREHLKIEDDIVFPKAEDVLTDADWDSLEEQFPPGEDPVFGKEISDSFRSLFQYLNEG